MMKQTLCLLLTVALVAQICGASDDNADPVKKTKETAEKAAADGKDMAGAAATGAENAAKDVAHATNKAAGAAGDAMRKAGNAAEGALHGGKDGHKHGAAAGKPHNLDRPVTRFVKGLEETAKHVADESTKIATGLFGLFGI